MRQKKVLLAESLIWGLRKCAFPLCRKKSYTYIWYHCTIPGWHKLIFSGFRGSSSAPSLLQNISRLCLITRLILAPGGVGQMLLLLLPWASEVVAGSSTQWHFPREFPNLGSAVIFAAYHLLMHWTLEGKSRLFLHAAGCWALLESCLDAFCGGCENLAVPFVFSAERAFFHMLCYYTDHL